jgi:hypothetical protein
MGENRKGGLRILKSLKIKRWTVEKGVASGGE